MLQIVQRTYDAIVQFVKGRGQPRIASACEVHSQILTTWSLVCGAVLQGGDTLWDGIPHPAPCSLKQAGSIVESDMAANLRQPRPGRTLSGDDAIHSIRAVNQIRRHHHASIRSFVLIDSLRHFILIDSINTFVLMHLVRGYVSLGSYLLGCSAVPPVKCASVCICIPYYDSRLFH